MGHPFDPDEVGFVPTQALLGWATRIVLVEGEF
jgi:hypothetical protein